MSICDTEEEARGEGLGSGNDAVWFEYDFEGQEFTNERMRADLPPSSSPTGTPWERGRCRDRPDEGPAYRHLDGLIDDPEALWNCCWGD
jgi:hypothetical protein